jgi:hypothetical protein
LLPTTEKNAANEAQGKNKNPIGIFPLAQEKAFKFNAVGKMNTKKGGSFSFARLACETRFFSDAPGVELMTVRFRVIWMPDRCRPNANLLTARSY